MKTYKIIAFSLLVSSLSNAQTLADARKKTENERFEMAGKDFCNLIAKEPKRADYYFYYGENFLEHGDIDSANIIWGKGIVIDPTSPLNYVGLAKYNWYKGDTTAANVHILKAFSLTKNKNPEIHRQVATIYIKTPVHKKLDAAIVLLNKAISLDPNNPENFLLMGDALLEKTPANSSPAIKNYNKAIELNPVFPKAIVRTAKIYQRAGSDSLANSIYIKAQTIDPTYAPAFRENAELNMKFNQTNKAVENWKKYLALNNSNEARYRYATSLFSGKKYCEAIVELLNVQAGGIENMYIERMLTYSYFECNETEAKISSEKGLEASSKFFTIAPKEKVLASDYKYKGNLLIKAGKDSLGIIEFENAAKLDPLKAGETYGEIAKIHIKTKQYSKAIIAYELKRKGKFNNLTTNEVHDLARAYFYGPKDYVMADSCYTNLAFRSPTYSPAFLGQGRSICRQDLKNEKWLAKNAFTSYLELLKPEDKTNANNKAAIMEASKYLGDYYLKSPEKDKVKAKIYWEMVRTLEPTDPQAKAFFASPDAK